MAMNKVLGTYEPDNLFAANQELPAVADTLEIAEGQDLKRGTLVNVDGKQIAATIDPVKATGTLKFTSNDLDMQIVKVGNVERVFANNPDPEEDNPKQIAIGVTLEESIGNFINELLAEGEVTASQSNGILTVTAVVGGVEGNEISLSQDGGEVVLSGRNLSGGEESSCDTGVYAVLAEDCDTTEGAKDAAVYLTGEFNIDAVKVNENVDDMAAIKIAARKVGIFLKKNI